jgi:hypothetical protein
MEDELNPYMLPETTAIEIIDKIEAMTPRSDCREIYRLIEKLKEIL